MTLHQRPELGAVLAVVLFEDARVELHAGTKAAFFHAGQAALS